MHRLLLALALTSVAATARAASDFDHLGVPNRDSNDVSHIDVPAPPRGAAGHRAPVAAQPDLTKDGDEPCGADRVGVIDVASGTLVKDSDLRQPQLVAGLNDPQVVQGAVDVTATPNGASSASPPSAAATAWPCSVSRSSRS